MQDFVITSSINFRFIHSVKQYLCYTKLSSVKYPGCQLSWTVLTSGKKSRRKYALIMEIQLWDSYAKQKDTQEDKQKTLCVKSCGRIK